MNPKQATQQFDELSQRCSGSFRFQRRALFTFSRSDGDNEAFLLFGLRHDPRGFFATTGSVGLRFHKLVPLLGHENIQVNTPLHILIGDGKFREWQFTNGAQLQALSHTVTEAIKIGAEPFLGDNSSLGKLVGCLRDTKRRSVYVLTPEQHVVLLAAAQWVLGDKKGAIESVESALAELTDALPKKRNALEVLRNKFRR